MLAENAHWHSRLPLLFILQREHQEEEAGVKEREERRRKSGRVESRVGLWGWLQVRGDWADVASLSSSL